MYFFNCSSEIRCKHLFEIINFLKKIINFFDIPDLINSNSILAIVAISWCFKKSTSSSVLTL